MIQLTLTGSDRIDFCDLGITSEFSYKADPKQDGAQSLHSHMPRQTQATSLTTRMNLQIYTLPFQEHPSDSR